jgi:hypothetical protein
MIYGIKLSNGEQLLDMDRFSPTKIGYQMIHHETGRLLPMCNRNEVYSAWAATEKMGKVAMSIRTLDIMDYIMKPVFDNELTSYKLITGEIDRR